MKMGQYASTDKIFRELRASDLPAATKRTVRNYIRGAEHKFNLGRTIEGHQLLDTARRLMERAQ